MRTRWMATLAVGVVALACAVGPAGAQPAAAQEPPKPPAPKPAPAPAPPARLRYVPQRPFDVLMRFFDLNEEQRKKVAEVRTQWYADRQEAIEKLNAELDAKYLQALLDLLDPEVRGRFARVQEAVSAYQQALIKAREEFKTEWRRITGSPLRYTPYSVGQIATTLPGLDAETRAKVRQAFYRDLYRELSERVRKALEEQGIRRPAGPARAGDAAARSEYYRRRLAVQQEIRRSLEAEVLEKIRAELPEAARAQLDKLLAAHAAFQAKQEAAMSMLVAALKDLVPVEKLNAPYPVRTRVRLPNRQGGRAVPQ